MPGDKKLNIAFVWYFDKASQVYDNWRDGLRSAMDIVAKKHNVSWYLDKEVPDFNEKLDFILLWDDTNSKFFDIIDKYKCKKGLCLTTMPSNIQNLQKMDVVYCESTPVFHEVMSHSYRIIEENYNQVVEPVFKAIKAFGTDTDLFKPNSKVVKDIPYFYPATFSPWKRQDEIADLSNSLYLVGTIQPDGMDIYQRCANRGCIIETGYFPVSKIVKMYQRAENVILPAVHGSERTCLEAMACDILPIVIHPQNDKLYSYILEFKESGLKSPREFVLKNYSHEIYAQKLLEGIES